MTLQPDYGEEPETSGLTVQDAADASRTLERVRWRRERIEEVEAVYEHRLADLTHWRDAEVKRHQSSLGYLQSLLEGYMRARAAEDPKLRTLSLPEGDLSLHRMGPHYDRDEAILLDYCKEAGYSQFVKIKETLAWADLKKEVTYDLDSGAVYHNASGERLPGVTAAPQSDRFEVKLR